MKKVNHRLVMKFFFQQNYLKNTLFRLKNNISQPNLTKNNFALFRFSTEKNKFGANESAKPQQSETNKECNKGKCTNQKCSDNKQCTDKNSEAQNVQIPAQNLQISHSRTFVGENQIDYFQTKGAISVLSHELIQNIKGAKKSQSGQLYALKFRCGQCNTQAIKSFTKQAYNHGVVMLRCDGCDSVHLVADNLGWFQDDPTNLDTLYKNNGDVQKVYDPVAVTKFLKIALGIPNNKESSKNQAEQNLKASPQGSETSDK